MTHTPRNVLLVTADHWPGSLLGIAGHPAVQTPTLDQLARCGVRYPRAYTECPVCIPARRTLLTGTAPRTHGDRTFQTQLPLPQLPTVADEFRGHGYQCAAVGKLHVYPPRARAGFDEVVLCEEGRPQLGPTDDYEIYLADEGLAGQQFLHGMSNNDYVSRPWHLEETHHVTNWLTRQMARVIQRRDPTRPAFWYLSYTHPHPPLTPPACYLELYRQADIPTPYYGTWQRHPDRMPTRMNSGLIDSRGYDARLIRSARQAFYALCTHIDHQLRVVLGTLREEELLSQTAILFLADHGDMLGNHGQWAKRLFYEDAARVPMLIVPAADDGRVSPHSEDRRLVGLQDVMPTLLDLAGLPLPVTCDGHSMLGGHLRETLYGEYGEGREATRMLHDGRHKLIYYAAGNRLQLFDLDEDPHELHDVIDRPGYQPVRQRLVERLVGELYGSDLDWLREGKLVGLADFDDEVPPNRNLALQRGSHWPVPPQGHP